MNALTKIIGASVAVIAAISLFSCTNEVEYTPADPVDGPQVYFSPDLESTIELSTDASSFDIGILRATSEDAVSFNLNVTDGSGGLFSIPTTVSFAAGETSTTMTVGYSYNEDDFPFGTYYEVVLSIPDDYSTPYGLSEYTFTAGVAEPWTSLGTALYRDDFITAIYGVGNEEWEVEIQENQIRPGLFRLVYPYDGKCPLMDNWESDPDDYAYGESDWDMSQTYYLEINCEDPDCCYIEYQPLGVDWGYGMMRVMSMGYYYYYYGGYDWAEVKAEGYGGTYDGQTITFPTGGLLFGMDNFGTGGLYEANAGGMFRVVMPGVVIGDYSVGVTYSGKYTDLNDVTYAIANVTLGDDVEYAEVGLFSGTDYEADYESIVAGSATTQTVTESGNVTFELDENGTFTIVAVSYGGGSDREYAHVTFKNESASTTTPRTWTSLGYCEYTEDFVASVTSVDPVTYEVEIQEADDAPGLYRLVNPYGAIFPYNEDNADGDEWDDSKDYYIEINATDPTGVYIDYQDTGLYLIGQHFYVYSYAAYYMDNGLDLETVKSLGYCGTLSNGTITFPYNTLLCYMPGFNSSAYYNCNTNNAFKIVLPGTSDLSGIVGTYDMYEQTYYSSTVDNPYWVIDYSDNQYSNEAEQETNVMVTVFDGKICETPIYGYYDEETMVMRLFDDQYFMKVGRLDPSGSSTRKTYYLYFGCVGTDYADFQFDGHGTFEGGTYSQYADSPFIGYFYRTSKNGDFIDWSEIFCYVKGSRSTASTKPASIFGEVSVGPVSTSQMRVNAVPADLEAGKKVLRNNMKPFIK